MLTNSRDVIERLLSEGFAFVSQRGSHRKYLHPASRRVVIVPHPKRDIPLGTMRSIYRQAGWRPD